MKSRDCRYIQIEEYQDNVAAAEKANTEEVRKKPNRKEPDYLGSLFIKAPDIPKKVRS